MRSAPFATVLVPTHDHTHLIGYALRCIQEQRFEDFELLVVGDGAPPATREIVEQLARSDRRIRYFDFPKGERHGEAHRHVALQQARGRIVSYCGDDDLWLPNHLARMAKLLGEVDFGHAVQVNLFLDGIWVVGSGELSDPELRRKLRDVEAALFGLSVTGHRMAAYRRLPEGWSPAPLGVYTDQFMWGKFMRMPGLRAGTHVEATAMHIVSPLRVGWTAEDREQELAALFRRRNTQELKIELDSAIRKAFPDWTPPPEPLLARILADLQRRWQSVAGSMPS